MTNFTKGAAVLLAVAGLCACGGGTDEGEMAEPAAGSEAAQREFRRAIAYMEPKSDSDVMGTAIFLYQQGTVELQLNLEGVPPGTHAVHLHETGDCSAPDASSAGGHWNPTEDPHGKWNENGFHLGDIGNLEAGDDGMVEYSMSTDMWDLGSGTQNDILGKALVVHAQADDFTSQPSGAAGDRIACGVLEMN